MKPLPPVSRLDLDHTLDHTRYLWDELRGQRIFITGGTGFFGCWLLESFTWAVEQLGLDTQAFILTRSPDTFRQKVPHLADHRSVTLIQGDIRNFDFIDGEYSHVIHAATESSTKLNTEDPLLMLDTIIDGTRHTLDFAASHGTNKLLLTSSGAVYGKQPPDMIHIPEDYLGAPDTMNPNSAYGQGKRTAEFLCTQYSRQFGFEAKIARCFAFVGPHLPLNAHFAIGNFIRDAMNGGPIIVKGNGTPHRSYLYAADLAIWLWTILLRGESCHAFNVGSEESLSIADTAQMVACCVSSNMKVEIQGKINPNHAVERYVPATNKAQTELKLQQTIGLDEAIKRTVQFLKSSY
jgi:dTDP-glucose 4,6-dehydratase